MVIRLNGTIQREDSLAIFLDWIEPWLTDKILQEACHKYNIEQEIYRAQKAHQNWIAWAFTQEFQKRFSKNPYNNVCPAVPLSKDIIEEDNRCLIRDPTTDEVWLAVKQISL